MALETLAGVDNIGGFDVVVMDELREKYPEKFNESGGMDYAWFEAEVRPKNFIYIRNDKNSIAFTLQKGPVKEVGVNGCQVQTILDTAFTILNKLNKNFPCKYNELALIHVASAVEALELRTKDREERGVEGTSQK